MELDKTSQIGPYPTSLKDKGREGRDTFRVAKLCYYNSVIKVALPFMTLVLKTDLSLRADIIALRTARQAAILF